MVALMSALLVSAASAQPTLENIRIGTVSGTGGLQLVNLFVVPAGFNFVLTDLEWSPDMNFSSGFLRLPLSLQVSGGACVNGPVAQWFALLYDDLGAAGGRQVANLPLAVHWSTGIPFCTASTMQLNIGNLSSSISWRINWSGYVVPTSFGAVDRQPGEQLGLDIAPNPTTRAARIQFDLASQSSVVLGIFDVQGRRVRTLYKGDLAAGPHALEWDGRRDDGRMARDGVYVAQLETPNGTRREKLTRVR